MRALAIVCIAAAPLFADGTTVTVRLRGATQSIARERYVAAVLAGESSVFRSDAALRAMAIAARTYAVRERGRHQSEGYDFCATTHCQRVDLDAITPRLEAAASATAGELLWYEGKPALAFYSRDCGGRTAAGEAPYLNSHDDPHCLRAGSSSWRWSGGPAQIAAALQRAGLRSPRTVDTVAVAQRDASGRAATLQLGGAGESVRISAGSFRFAIGRELGWNTILSDLYDVVPSGGRVIFQGRGSGNGVGLCQRGADQMGVEGRSERDILAFYYPGTTLGTTARGISWQRIAGDSIAVLTTDPQQARALLSTAESQLRALVQRTGWPAPAGIEIRLYPDLDTYRDATGEPGWVAAYTSGRRIHLQPAAVLRRRNALDDTVRHELLHVLLESQAAPGLPLWFREGLVESLDRAPHATGDSRTPTDADLRQTADSAQARRAYQDAARKVAALVNRYGEATVLGWVQRGLPAEVRKANAIDPSRKSK